MGMGVSTRRCIVSITFCPREGIKKDPIFRNSNAAGVSKDGYGNDNTTNLEFDWSSEEK